MRFLIGWALKLSLVGVVYLGMTSGFKVKLPEEVLGYKVPTDGAAVGRPQRPDRRVRQAGPGGLRDDRRAAQVNYAYGERGGPGRAVFGSPAGPKSFWGRRFRRR